MEKIDQIKEICEVLKSTAEEVQKILSTEERDNFAIGFLHYVESTYDKKNEQYYFKNPLINHVHRNVNDVLYNYVNLIYEKQGT